MAEKITRRIWMYKKYVQIIQKKRGILAFKGKNLYKFKIIKKNLAI